MRTGYQDDEGCVVLGTSSNAIVFTAWEQFRAEAIAIQTAMQTCKGKMLMRARLNDNYSFRPEQPPVLWT